MSQKQLEKVPVVNQRTGVVALALPNRQAIA
jgi:hypothetical protein